MIEMMDRRQRGIDGKKSGETDFRDLDSSQILSLVTGEISRPHLQERKLAMLM
jgi:hypothetical protein